MSAPANEPPFARVGIVGLGLIGGSIALGVRAAWPSVTILGVDRPPVIEDARARHVIDEARPTASDLGDADLIVLATPVNSIISTIASLGSVQHRAVVTDVGSTKRRVLEAAQTAGLRQFIGGHPMAGSERGGLEHARIGLFAGRPWFLTAGAGTPAAIRERIAEVVHVLGAAPIAIGADEHDRTMAYVSHLPQLLSLALMTTAGRRAGEHALSWAGRGFEDMTRLAASSPDVWTSVIDSNADYITEALRELGSTLAALPTDAVQLREIFNQANDWRRELERRRGGVRG